MLFTRFKNNCDRAQAQTAIYKFTTLCTSVVALASIAMAVHFRDYETTHIVPTTIREPLTIKNGRPDDAYLRNFAHLVASLGFNFSPPTAEARFADLLALFHPSVYPEQRKAWDELLQNIQLTGVTTVFFLDAAQLVVDERTREITIEGLRTQFKGSSVVDSGPITYTVKYIFEGQRFWLTDILENTPVRTRKPRS